MSHQTLTEDRQPTTPRFGGHDTRHVPLFLMLVIVALSSACAEIGACPPAHTLVDGRCTPPLDPCPDQITKTVRVACVVDPALDALSPGTEREPLSLPWELTVRPGPIISGKQIAVTFDGRVHLPASNINDYQRLTPDGFRRFALTNLEARVTVRKGAEGDDVVLEVSPIPRTCSYDEDGNKGPDAGPEFPSCSQESDNEDGSNDECTGLGGAPDPGNPCLAFIQLQTDDCTAGGECAKLGQAGRAGSPCDMHGFCVTHDLVIELEMYSAVYIADQSGSVLFGWADQGVDLLEEGPNRGAYALEAVRRGFEEPIVMSGLDVVVDTGQGGGQPVAFECVMGVFSRGPDGVPTIDPLVSPSPDGVLISCPIQEPE